MTEPPPSGNRLRQGYAGQEPRSKPCPPVAGQRRRSIYVMWAVALWLISGSAALAHGPAGLEEAAAVILPILLIISVLPSLWVLAFMIWKLDTKHHKYLCASMWVLIGALPIIIWIACFDPIFLITCKLTTMFKLPAWLWLAGALFLLGSSVYLVRIAWSRQRRDSTKQGPTSRALREPQEPPA